ncbi:membrane protein [Pseudomonas antarctica]|uniref:Membrane protein n=1 Tax=Pseudomonas antarctica TaxID=219572 RepID=A0A172Z666_9PSED|nr:membrane protein [Pseudomonas antarctica]
MLTLDSNKLPAEHLLGGTTTQGPATVENLKQFNSFAEFYPYYLSEHGNSTCRRLHFIGTTLVIGILAYAIGRGSLGLLLALPIAGYSFAWVGHFFFEKNRPATFQHPFYSLLGDFVMYRDMIVGKVPF